MRIIPGNAQAVGDRESQQDFFGFSDFGDRAFRRHGGVMMVLCDGMGGLANGALASRTAVEAILSAYYRKQPSESIAGALQRAFRELQRAVCEIPSDDGSAGTTTVVAVVWQGRLYWASLGDSRLYLCRNGAPPVQLTEDDNIATDLARRAARGEISENEANAAADREALTGYLGSPEPPQPHIFSDGLPLQPGDRIVACSDGLYRGLLPDAMAASARCGDAMSAAQNMVELVLRQRLPHQDNVTAVVLEIASTAVTYWWPKTVGEGAMAGGAGGLIAGFLLAVVLNAVGILDLATHQQIPIAPAAVETTTIQKFIPAPLNPGAAEAPKSNPAPPPPPDGASPAPTGNTGAQSAPPDAKLPGEFVPPTPSPPTAKGTSDPSGSPKEKSKAEPRKSTDPALPPPPPLPPGSKK